MSSVDERVVEMRFDNAQFEHGVQQTLSSLDRLKEGLKFNNALNGLGNLQNAFNGLKLNGIDNGVDKLNKKFSAMGIAGQELAKRVANSAITAVKNVTMAVPNQIKNGGWLRASNLAGAKFQLQGLGIEWKNVGNDISYAVNQTSYGLDEAAKIAGQLAASGVKVGNAAITSADDVGVLADKWDNVADRSKAAEQAMNSGDLDQMSVALRAISGVASMTGSSFQEIGQIFSRVAGQGRMYATDLNSLAVRGMNATAILAKALGKSEADIRDMTSKGEIDFDTFSNAMYNAFANQATKANDTFTGSLANMKAALSRIGADVADDVLPAGTKVFNSLRLLFNQIHTTIQPVLDSLGKMVVAGGNTISAVIDTITGKMKSGGKAFTTPIQVIAKAIDGITAGIEAIGQKFNASPVVSGAKEVASALQEVNEKTKTLANIKEGFANIGKVVANVGDAIKESILWTIRDWSKDLGKINGGSLSKAFADFTGSFAKDAFRMERVRQIIGNVINSLGMAIKPVIQTVKTFGQALGETLASAYQNGNWLADLSWRFRQLSQAMVLSKDGTKGLHDVFTALLSPIRVIVPAVAKVISIILQLGTQLAKLNNKFLELVGRSNIVGKLGDGFTKFGNSVKNAFGKIKDGVKNGSALDKVGKTFSKLSKSVKDSGALEKFGSVLGKIGESLGKAFSGIKDWASNSKFFSNLGTWFKTAAQGIGEFFSKLKDTEGFQHFISSLKQLGTVVGGGIINGLQWLGEKLGFVGRQLGGMKVNKSALDTVVDFFAGLADKLGSAMDALSSVLSGKKSPLDVLKEGISGIGKFFSQSKIFSGIGNFFKGAYNLFKDFDMTKVIGSLVDSIKKGIANFSFKDAFDGFWKAIHDALFGVDVMAAEQNGEAGAAKDAAEKQGGALSKSLTSFGNEVSASVSGFNWSGIGNAIKGGIGKVVDAICTVFGDKRIQYIAQNIKEMITALLLLRAVKNAGDMFKSFSGMANAIGGFFGKIGDKIAGVKKTKSKFKDFAETIAILVGCMAGIAAIKNIAGDQALLTSIEVLAGMVAALVGVMTYIGKAKWDLNNLKQFGKTSQQLGIAMGALTLSLGMLAMMKPETYMSGLKRLAGVLVLLGVVVGLMNRLSGAGRNPIKGSIFMGLAAGLTMLLIPLNILAKMQWDAYLDALKKLAILMGLLGGVVGAMNLLSGLSSGKGVGFGTLIGFAISLIALMKVMQQLTELASGDAVNNYQNILVAAGVISEVFLAFGAALALAGTNEHSSGTAVAFIFDILAVFTALATLSGEAALIGWQPMIAAATSMGIVFVALGAAIALAGTNKSSTTTAVAFIFDILAVFTALATLTEMAATMENGMQALITAAAAMSACFIALGAAMRLASGSQFDVGSIVAMVATVGTVALGLAQIAQYPWDQIAAAGAAMSGALLAVSAAMKIMSGAGGMSLGGILGMVAAVASVTASLMLLSQIPFNSIMSGAVGLAAGMAALAVGMAALSAASGAAAGVLASLAALGGGLAVAAAGVAAFGIAVQVAGAGIAAGAAQITYAVGSIMSVIPGLGKAGAAAKQAAQDINSFIVSTGKSSGKAIGGVINEAGKGAEQGAQHFANAGATLKGAGNDYQNGANQIKSAAQSTQGSGKMIEQSIKLDPAMGAKNVEQYGSGVVTATDNMNQKVAAKADETKQTLTKSLDFKSILSSMNGGGGFDMSSILSQIGIDKLPQDLSGKLKDSLSNINLQDMMGAMNGGGGLDISKLIPEDTWSQLPSEMQSKMSEAFSGIDMSSITASMNGGAGLDFSKIFGGDQVTAQAQQAGQQAGQSYATGISSGFQSGGNGVEQIKSGIQSGLQGTETVFSEEGHKAASMYGVGLTAGGGTVSGSVQNMITNATTALQTGTTQFSQAGHEAGQNYANGLSEGSQGGALAVSTMVNQIVNVIRSLSVAFTSEGQAAGRNYAQGLQSGGSGAALAVSTMVNQAVNAIRSQSSAFMSAGMACGQAFVQGLTQGGQNAGNAVRTLAMSARNALANMAGVFRTTGTVVIQAFVAGIKAGGSSAAGAARSISNQAANALRAGASVAGASARVLMAQFQAGIYAGGAGAVGAARSISNQAASALSAGSGYAYSSGVHLGQNFANGVRAGGAAAVAAARSIAAQVAAVLKHSKPKEGPLKDDDVWGKHMAQNFANGMEAGVPLVGKAAKNVANAAAKSADAVKKTLNASTAKKAVDPFVNELNKGAGRIEKSTVNIGKMVDDAWAEANKATKKKSKSSDSSSSEDDVSDKFVDNLSKSVEKASKANQLNLNDEVEAWRLAAAKIKKNASAAAKAEKNANDAIYDAAEKYLEKRKKQRGDNLTDETEFWKQTLKLVDKNSDAYDKALDKMNDSIVSDTEHMIDNQKKLLGDMVTDTRTYWDRAIQNTKEIAKQFEVTQKTWDELREKRAEAAYNDAEQEESNYEKMYNKMLPSSYWLAQMADTTGTEYYLKNMEKWNESLSKTAEKNADRLKRTEGKYVTDSYKMWVDELDEMEKHGDWWASSMEDVLDGLAKAAISDTKDLVDQQKYLYGDVLTSEHAPWRQMYYTLKETMESYGMHYSDLSKELRDEISENVGKAFIDDVSNLISTYNTWSEVTAENLNQNQKQQKVLLYKDLLETTKQGTAEQIAAQKEYYAASEQLMEEYTNNVRQKADSLMSIFNLTDDTTFAEAPTQEDLLRRANNADAALSRQEEYLGKLKQTGVISDDLLAKLGEIGTSNFRTLETLASMSSDQLQQIQDAWDHSKQHATDIAKMLNQPLLEGLDGAFKQMGEGITKQLQGLGPNISQGLMSGENLQAFTDGLTKLAEQSYGSRKFQSAIDQFGTIGKNISIGMANGIKSESNAVATAVYEIVNLALVTAQNTAQIHSPSRKTRKLGAYMGEGLALGIKEWFGRVAQTGAGLSGNAISGMNAALGSVTDGLDSDFEIRPVISPVVDLSDVNSAMRKLDAMTSRDEAMDVAAQFSASAMGGQNGGENVASTTTNKYGPVNINIYPTENQNANDIASDVMDKINNEIIRKGKVYYA